MDDESLQTFFIEIESILNNRPLTPVSDDPNDFSALTPMSLLHGSIDPVFPLDVFIEPDGYRRSWRRVQLLADRFWARWLKQYLPMLQLRQKWLQPSRNLRVGDLVLMKNEAVRRSNWPQGFGHRHFAGSRRYCSSTYSHCSIVVSPRCSKVVPAGGIGLIRSREYFSRGH